MLTYVTGDATEPQGEGHKIIAHVCNDVGGWGRGFVCAISKKWKNPEEHYRGFAKGNTLFLGDVQYTLCESGPDSIIVANMIAQKGYGKNNKNLHRSDETDERPPIRYDALRECLEDVSKFARDSDGKPSYTIHMPRIGCGLAGGKWEEVEPIIQETMGDIDVFVYDLPVQTSNNG